MLDLKAYGILLFLTKQFYIPLSTPSKKVQTDRKKEICNISLTIYTFPVG